jgi:hypothetical protein
VLRNDTIIDPTVRPEVSLWLAPDVDIDRALALLAAAEPGWAVRVAEVSVEGVRLALTGAPVVAEPAAAESAMRAAALRALRSGAVAGGGSEGAGTKAAGG